MLGQVASRLVGVFLAAVLDTSFVLIGALMPFFEMRALDVAIRFVVIALGVVVLRAVAVEFLHLVRQLQVRHAEDPVDAHLSMRRVGTGEDTEYELGIQCRGGRWTIPVGYVAGVKRIESRGGGAGKVWFDSSGATPMSAEFEGLPILCHSKASRSSKKVSPKA